MLLYNQAIITVLWVLNYFLCCMSFFFIGVTIHTWSSVYWLLSQTMQNTNLLCLRVRQAPRALSSLSCLLLYPCRCPVCYVSHALNQACPLLAFPSLVNLSVSVAYFEFVVFLFPQALSPFSMQKMSILNFILNLSIKKYCNNFLKNWMTTAGLS